MAAARCWLRPLPSSCCRERFEKIAHGIVNFADPTDANPPGGPSASLVLDAGLLTQLHWTSDQHLGQIAGQALETIQRDDPAAAAAAFSVRLCQILGRPGDQVAPVVNTMATTRMTIDVDLGNDGDCTDDDVYDDGDVALMVVIMMSSTSMTLTIVISMVAMNATTAAAMTTTTTKAMAICW